MNDSTKAQKKPKSIDEEIIAAEEKLRKLKETRKLQAAKEFEKNKKSIAELISKEKLDHVPIETWHKSILGIKKLLGIGDATGQKEVPAADVTSG